MLLIYRLSIKDTSFSGILNWSPLPRLNNLISKNCENYKEFISKSIEGALSMVVVREVTRDQLHNVLPLNVNVKKSNGKLRLIYNVMFINDYMSIPKFKYPQLHREDREIFGESSHAYDIDISQAFYQIEIDPVFHKFLGFFWEGKFY